MENYINLFCILGTLFYIVGIFYRRCYLDINKHKDKIGYTETKEYIIRLEKEMSNG